MKFNFKLMQATVGKFEDVKKKGYIYEPKLDGYRALCFVDKVVKFIGRSGRELTNDYPELRDIEVKAKTCVLDGEIIIYDKAGNPNFNLLQKHNDEANFIVFDILMKDKEDLRNLPLIERKKILDKVLKENIHFQKIVYTEEGRRLLKIMRQRRGEGIVAKEKDSIYEGRRSEKWRKIKFTKTYDCVIIGYERKKREIGSLLLGLWDKSKIRFVGKVGTGFNENKLYELMKIFERIKIPADSDGRINTRSKKIMRIEGFDNINNKNIYFLKPIMVCEIKYQEITSDKKFRAPVFLRLRADKKPKECVYNWSK